MQVDPSSPRDSTGAKDQTPLLLRIFLKDLPATPGQYLNDISLVEPLLDHVPDRVEPQAIPPEPSQPRNALQKSRPVRHFYNLA